MEADCGRGVLINEQVYSLGMCGTKVPGFTSAGAEIHRNVGHSFCYLCIVWKVCFSMLCAQDLGRSDTDTVKLLFYYHQDFSCMCTTPDLYCVI